MKTKMGLPEINFLRKKGIFNFAINKSVKIPILTHKKSNLGPIKNKKRAKSAFTEVNHSHLTAQEYCKLNYVQI